MLLLPHSGGVSPVSSSFSPSATWASGDTGGSGRAGKHQRHRRGAHHPFTPRTVEALGFGGGGVARENGGGSFDAAAAAGRVAHARAVSGSSGGGTDHYGASGRAADGSGSTSPHTRGSPRAPPPLGLGTSNASSLAAAAAAEEAARAHIASMELSGVVRAAPVQMGRFVSAYAAAKGFVSVPDPLPPSTSGTTTHENDRGSGSFDPEISATIQHSKSVRASCSPSPSSSLLLPAATSSSSTSLFLRHAVPLSLDVSLAKVTCETAAKQSLVVR
jgi:hypothetical protein